MKKQIIELEKEFIGVGEVKGFKFRQIRISQAAYIYEVNADGKMYYEVFKRLNSPVCINFEERLYSETEFKDIYPKANAFGISAWSSFDLEKATIKFNELQILHAEKEMTNKPTVEERKEELQQELDEAFESLCWFEVLNENTEMITHYRNKCNKLEREIKEIETR